MKQKRYLFEAVNTALTKKMAFIGGPRQVGKTTFALQFLKPSSIKNPSYMNWDSMEDKNLILKSQFRLQNEILVFDEIHKYRLWRNLIKGLYDKHHEDNKFIVTGSARLDYFRKGGDSLLGRYRYFRMHPFSITEMSAKPKASDLEQLLKFGGFPEPLFEANENMHRIWQRERTQRVVLEDLRDLQNIKETSALLMLAETLPSRVGSPLSLNNLAQDIQTSQPSINNWIEILSHLYYCFRIAPYGAPKLRAVKKLQKVYMWDWSQIENPGARFENLVASHLLKYCHYIEDTQGYEMSLRYLRDTDSREIDFVVLKNNKPIFAVECKTGDKQLSPHIKYFKERTNIPAFYQVHTKTADYGSEKTGRVMPFLNFCSYIGIP